MRAVDCIAWRFLRRWCPRPSANQAGGLSNGCRPIGNRCLVLDSYITAGPNQRLFGGSELVWRTGSAACAGGRTISRKGAAQSSGTRPAGYCRRLVVPAEIQILPDFQDREIGSSVIRSVMRASSEA